MYLILTFIHWNYVALLSQESEALALYHEALAFQKSGNFQEAERIYLDVLQTDLLTKVGGPFKILWTRIVAWKLWHLLYVCSYVWLCMYVCVYVWVYECIFMPVHM